MLAQHTRANTVLNNKYKITEKITDVVHRAVLMEATSSPK